jgi:hypothetical protein
LNRVWLDRRLRALKGASAIALLGIAPLVVGAATLWLEGQRGVVAEDFRHAFLPAARAIVHGTAIYPDAHDAVVSAGAAYVYPAPAAVLVTPFTALPDGIAVWVATVFMIALVPLVLAVLDVRDWRCYGAALLWAPVASSVQTANLSLVLALGLALAWRFRDRAAALPIAFATALKLLTWPLLVWAYATGRKQRAVQALVGTCLLIVVAWAAVGFSGFASYVPLVRRIDELEAGHAYTLYSFGLEIGLPAVLAKTVWLAAGAAALSACLLYGRRGDDRRSFILAVVACLALSPIVWLHYLALLLVPVAIARPRLSGVWLVPICLWVVPADGTGRAPWQTALVLATIAVVTASSLTRPQWHRSRELLAVGAA